MEQLAVQLQQELENVRKQMAEQASVVQALTNKMMEVQMDTEEDDKEEDQEQEVSWSSILAATAMEPKSAAAASLCRLLAVAPPMEQIRKSGQQVPRFKGVPVTPQARRGNRIDTGLFVVQQKLEHAMNMLVHHAEGSDPQSLQVVAAMLRSSWEDVQQNRRGLLAGKQVGKLAPRTDDDRVRLLTKEEEDKVRQGQATQKPFKARRQWRPKQSYDYVPWKKPSKGGGKGKGKGKPTSDGKRQE